ncbi:hypothetical protein ACWJKU_19755 (plasmid) [Methylocaldum sp. MU1018]|jgi:hypothetical protein
MHRKIELLPPETITCGCCRNAVVFGSNWCPYCGAGIKYHRTTLMTILGAVAMSFVLPLIQALVFPELAQRLGWPAVIGLSLILGVMLAWWAFWSFWPARHQVRAKFYRRTFQGFSPKSTDEEESESDLPCDLLIIVPAAVALLFLANQLSHALLGLFDADTGTLADRLTFLILMISILATTMVAVKLGVPDWLKRRRRNRFYA